MGDWRARRRGITGWYTAAVAAAAKEAGVVMDRTPKRFRHLRVLVAIGNTEAQTRLREHVQRRFQRGMAPQTIAKKIGIPIEQVYAVLRPSVDRTPRLVGKG